MTIKVELSGQKDLSSERHDQIEQERQVQEELSLLDVDIPRSSEIVLPMKDTPKTMEFQNNSASAGNVKTKLISDKQKAHLEKARQSKAEKQKLRKEGRDLGAEPDLPPRSLELFAKMLDDKFAEYNRTLSDYVLPIASERNLDEERKVKGEILTSQLERINAKSRDAVGVDSSSAIPSRDLTVDRAENYNYFTLQEPLKKVVATGDIEEGERIRNQHVFETHLKRKYPSRDPVLMEQQLSKKAMFGDFILF